MKILTSSLPEGFTLSAPSAGRAVVIYDVTEDGDSRVSVQTDSDGFVIYPDRSYKHRDLAKRLGYIAE